jgi:hypothetical protein
VSHYDIEELIARWKKEELSVEQVIGKLLVLKSRSGGGASWHASHASRPMRWRLCAARAERRSTSRRWTIASGFVHRP